MKLLIDLGNTRLKWRLVEGDRRIAEGRVQSQAPVTDLWQSLPDPLFIHGACVASETVRQAIDAHCMALWGLPVVWLAVADQACGVRNHYQLPGLGADRWASVIAAHRWLNINGEGAALAVNVGTAITIDGVTAAGDYLGGSILPGLYLMRAALASQTAQLPMAEGAVQAWPRCTVDAISTGVVDAACGAIERLAARLPGPVQLLLSGGDAEIVAAHLPATVQKVENLVLDGLQVIAR